MRLQFPVYVIASREGIVAVKTDGGDCVMLFRERGLAKQQVERIGPLHPSLGPICVRAIADAAALRSGLASLPPDIVGAVWDPTGAVEQFERLGIDELLRALGDA